MAVASCVLRVSGYEVLSSTPFERLTVLSRVEGLTTLSFVEGLTVLSLVEGQIRIQNVKIPKHLEDLNFEFVSNLGFRASDFLLIFC
jgi:hypothetical protein